MLVGNILSVLLFKRPYVPSFLLLMKQNILSSFLTPTCLSLCSDYHGNYVAFPLIECVCTFINLFLGCSGLTATLSNSPDKEVHKSLLQAYTYVVVFPDVNKVTCNDSRCSLYYYSDFFLMLCISFYSLSLGI